MSFHWRYVEWTSALPWGNGVAVLTVILLPFLLGCGGVEEEISPEEFQIVSSLARPAAAELMRTLVGELTAAMEEGGPENAVAFCSSEAIPLTEAVEGRVQGGLELKRTSSRYRNPENAPDQAEEEALRHFERVVEGGTPPPSSYVQRVSAEEYRYYQPLMVGEFCLQCHGAPETMSPQVRGVLEEEYPGDLATGYEAGDFRGLVRVSVPASLVADREGS